MRMRMRAAGIEGRSCGARKTAPAKGAGAVGGSSEIRQRAAYFSSFQPLGSTARAVWPL